jgi:hypothetical protein
MQTSENQNFYWSRKDFWKNISKFINNLWLDIDVLHQPRINSNRLSNNRPQLLMSQIQYNRDRGAFLKVCGGRRAHQGSLLIFEMEFV